MSDWITTPGGGEKKKIFWNHHLGETHSQKATIWHGGCQFLIDFIWLKEVDYKPTIPHSGSFNNGAITRVYTQPFNTFYGNSLVKQQFKATLPHPSSFTPAFSLQKGAVTYLILDSKEKLQLDHGCWLCGKYWDSKDLVLTLNKNAQVGVSSNVQHVGSAGGVCPAWNNVDCDYMWWVSAAVCCSCNHGVDFMVFFHIKCVFFRSRLHIMFSDAIDHWMFWQCPNVSFFRQIWRKNQQPPVIYSVSIWHDLPCMLFGGVWLGASCCGKVQLRSIEMCASAKNISCLAPRCVQLQRTSVA